MLGGVAVAQTQSTDSGNVTLTATVSGYVDIAAGGPITLTGASNGSITGNKNKGEQLTGVTINLGDISPVNASTFVVATVPLRLRSNIGYTLSITASGFANADPMAVQPADVGFGVGNVLRTDSGVNTSGTDTPVAAAAGNPSADPDGDVATPRWDYVTEKSLAHYTTSRSVLSGDRIMRVVPSSHVGGLTLDTFFVIKPQFFSPGGFTTTVTYTITTP